MQVPISAPHLSIGTVARRTGLAVSAIRYYEEVGLVSPGNRSEGGHRLYPDSVIDVLTLIKHCRDLGFSIEDTRMLILLADTDRDCRDAREIAKSHLAAVRTKIAELRLLEHSLARFVLDCDQECAGGPAAQCCIFEDLRKWRAKPNTNCC